ncbi:MAG: hypothetical protein K6U75_12510 [Firmicutes bacterium]|nr:hypothetical protein [Bacillota bacterium]
MPQSTALDTQIICGVPVLQWRGVLDDARLGCCERILQSLTHSGYRELVLDLRQASIGAPRELWRLLRTLEKMLPAHAHAEVVLPAGSPPVRQPKRIRIAQSVALALSHITRIPAASLQASLTVHVRWQEDQG